MLFCACAAGGCATLAKRPPTPADDISPRQAASIVAPPSERFFIIVFSSECKPVRPKYTHCWATLVKATDSPGPHTCTVEESTISWMPASLELRPWSFRVEPGVNLPLRFTIEEMLRNREEIAFWGPYEVGPGFAYRFELHKAFMESGHVGYQVIDSVGDAGRCGAACNCIHAITDMDPVFDRRRYPLAYFGHSASWNIVRELHARPMIINPDADHAWLLARLGLDRYPMERRRHLGRTVPYTPENQERYLRRYER